MNGSAMTRPLAAGAAILALSGCLHEERRLKGKIENVTPAGFERIDCSFASGLFGDEPASESCVFVVRRASVADAEAVLRRTLTEEVGPVQVAEYGDAVELSSSGDGVDYRARIGPTPGSLSHYLAPRTLPTGGVGVVLYASEER